MGFFTKIILLGAIAGSLVFFALSNVPEAQNYLGLQLRALLGNTNLTYLLEQKLATADVRLAEWKKLNDEKVDNHGSEQSSPLDFFTVEVNYGALSSYFIDQARLRLLPYLDEVASPSVSP